MGVGHALLLDRIENLRDKLQTVEQENVNLRVALTEIEQYFLTATEYDIHLINAIVVLEMITKARQGLTKVKEK